MPGCDTDNGLLREVLVDVLAAIEGPILFDFPSGHGPRNLTIPSACQCEYKRGW